MIIKHGMRNNKGSGGAACESARVGRQMGLASRRRKPDRPEGKCERTVGLNVRVRRGFDCIAAGYRPQGVAEQRGEKKGTAHAAVKRTVPVTHKHSSVVNGRGVIAADVRPGRSLDLLPSVCVCVCVCPAASVAAATVVWQPAPVSSKHYRHGQVIGQVIGQETNQLTERPPF